MRKFFEKLYIYIVKIVDKIGTLFKKAETAVEATKEQEEPEESLAEKIIDFFPKELQPKMKEGIPAIVDPVKEFFEGIWGWLKAVAGAIKDGVVAVAGAIKDGVVAGNPLVILLFGATLAAVVIAILTVTTVMDLTRVAINNPTATFTPTFTAPPTLVLATITQSFTNTPIPTNTPAPTNTPTIIPTLTPTPIAFVPGVYYRETTFQGQPAFEFLRFTSQGQVYQLGVSGVPKGDVKTAFNIVDPKLNAADPASAKGPYSILGNVITSTLKTQTGEIYKFEGAIIDASQLSLNKTSPDGKFEAMVLFALLLGGG